MEIILRNIGQSLGTRQLGEKLRNEIIASICEHNSVTINFEGVDVISNSFADECFAKILCTHDINFVAKNIKFVNANDFVRTVIKHSLRQRSMATA